MKLTPTTVNKRIEALDLLRGFSLLGILIANMLMFHTPYFHIEPYAYFTERGELTAFKWIVVFVQSSFYPIFAFLFGYGLNMQYEKALERNQPFVGMMTRRLFILLIFGLLHALFIWSGDVLFTYAALGFTLIFFVRIPARWLAPFALVLYAIPGGFLYFITKLVLKMDPTTFENELNNSEQAAKAIHIFANGSIGEIFSFRAIEWVTYGLSSTFLGLFIVLPIILFGAAASKWKVIERAAQLKLPLAIVGVVAGAIGIWIKMLPFTKGPTYDLIQLQQTFGGVILAVGYVALFLVLTTSTKFRTFFSPLGKTGRMSLTTYITQSIIATTIFYAYGFGLYGKVSLWTGTAMALGIFVLQVIFAECWFTRFKMGPIEKIWRIGIYGKKTTK